MRRLILPPIVLCFGLTILQSGAQSYRSDGSVRTQIEGIDIPTVADAPFTAKVVVMWDEPLIGGGRISRTYYTQVARDSQGRVRRETRSFVAAHSGAEPTLRTFSILDPVAGTRTRCTAATMSCTTTNYEPRQSLGAPADETFSGSNVKRVSLGERSIDAMRVEGIRETATNSAGERGNSELVVSNRELWYSPDLQMDLSVTRNNPQLGEVTLSVINLVRGQPDPSWLTVPSGYTVKDARGR